MRRALGDGYVDAVRSAYSGSVSDSADFVMYWWHIAAETVRDKKSPAQRFGFITTNSLRQTFNRRIVEPQLYNSKQPLSLSFAIADHPWVDGNDGAAVRIAMTVGVSEDVEGVLQQVISESSDADTVSSVTLRSRSGKIFADLNVGANVTVSRALEANSNICSKGFEPGNEGFVINKVDAKALDQSVKSNSSEVIRPYLNGKDLINQPKGMWLIDCFGYELNVLRDKYPLIYQHLLETVKPQREQNRDRKLRKYWWLHRRSRAELRSMMEGISTYITTVETSKHRFFTVLDKTVAPSNLLVNIATENKAHFGILSSRIHSCWALAVGGRLGVGNDPRYNKTRCFETFPFPDFDNKESEISSELAVQIDDHRKRQQSQNEKLTLTNIYNVLEKLRKEESLSAKEQDVNQQGLVSTLRELHDELDSAVFAAYGWQDLGEKLVGLPGATTPLPDKGDVQAKAEEELLTRLVELNKQRAAEETRGNVRWLRPDYQAPDSVQAHIDITADKVNADTEKNSAVMKMTWPKDVHEQINVLLDSLSTPTTAENIAERFKRKPLKYVEAVLDALETLGKAQQDEGLWSLT